ncbi:MAG TPA: metal ABC transporter permease [Acidimicrobiales bacterium]|nr:metal ABC transporter permease [Acidimicrobiales bacterium]
MTADGPQLSWDIVADVREVLTYPFMVNAVLAGTVVAVLAALVGWFMVLRKQAFTGHTLAVVGFPGAAAALLLGVSVTYGFFAFSLAAALLIAAARVRGGRGPDQESAVTGIVQALALALGFWFSTLYAGFSGGATALLFGNFLGVTRYQVQVLALVALLATAALVVFARPLLFASLDPVVAHARGVPVRTLDVAFLVLLAFSAAAVAQITGTLLVFALLVVPAATAQLLTLRSVAGVALAVVLGVAIIWAALFVAYFEPYPIGFFVTSFAFAAYVVARAGRRVASTRRSPRARARTA